MNKKIPLGAAIAFMVVVAGITLCITMMISQNYFNTKLLNVTEREAVYKKLADIDRECRQRFAGTIDEEVLTDAISRGYIWGMGDSYSTYLTQSEYEERLQEENGQRVSIGASIEVDQSKYMRVKRVLAGSPAEQNGLMTGDLLISIDGTDLHGVSQAAAERLLKGQPGTKATIVCRRDGIDETKTIQRKEMEMEYVQYRMIDQNGYIKITSFNSKTYSQFKKAVDALIQRGATGLIFDVRDNTSNSVTAAADMLDMLLPSGMIGSIVEKKPTGNVTTKVMSDEYEVALPMAVLVNAKTGGAAEFFVAGLHDFKQGEKSQKLGQSVGTQTLGKSAIQELLPLTDGSAINLTTAHFLTPDGVNIQNAAGGTKGIKPDYEVKLSTEQEQNFSSLTDDTDPQIKKAVEVVNSKKAVS